jgi:competence protein ComEC
MVLCLLGFSLGAIVLHCTSWLIPLPETFMKVLVFTAFSAALATVSTSYLFLQHRQRLALAAASFAMIAGLTYASLEASQHRQSMLKLPIGAPVLASSAYACSLVREREYFNQIDMCVEQAYLSKSSAQSGKLGRYRLTYAKELFEPFAHPCWSLEMALKPPRATYNPWVTSYERHLFYQGVLGLGRVLTAVPTDCADGQPILSKILALRQNARSHMQDMLGQLAHPGLIEALVLGERSKIEAEENRILAASGTQHLMAISGLHVGLVCWFVFSVFTALRLNRMRFFGVAVVGLVYILFVGFSPSAQRAWVMVLCALVIVLGYVPRKPWVAFLSALAVVLLLDPLAPLNLGFWFSFCAVGSLILMAQLSPAGLRNQPYFKQLLALQVGLLVLLLFAQSAFAMPLSGLAWLANLIAIPWVSFVVLPLSLFSFVLSYVHEGLALFGFQLADAVLDFLLAFLGALAEAEWQWRLPAAPWVKLIIFMLVIALFLARFSRVFSLLLAALLFSLIGLTKPANTSVIQSELLAKAANFWVLDVGQGLSIVAQYGASIWVYDTGPAYERFSSARSILYPLIETFSVDSTTSGMIVSHGDADHAGDYAWFAQRFLPGNIWLGESERTPLGLVADSCLRGQRWPQSSQHGGTDTAMGVEVLWPRDGYQASSSNNHSCVVRFTLHGVRFLVMGDLENQGEQAMLEWLAEHQALNELKADVLIAGHHGAEAASSMTLLKHVQPDYVVFSAGYLNRFHHPSVGAQRRARRIKAQALNTFDTGAIRFSVSESTLDELPLKPYLGRELATDYWVLK